MSFSRSMVLTCCVQTSSIRSPRHSQYLIEFARTEQLRLVGDGAGEVHRLHPDSRLAGAVCDCLVDAPVRKSLGAPGRRQRTTLSLTKAGCGPNEGRRRQARAQSSASDGESRRHVAPWHRHGNLVFTTCYASAGLKAARDRCICATGSNWHFRSRSRGTVSLVPCWKGIRCWKGRFCSFSVSFGTRVAVSVKRL